MRDILLEVPMIEGKIKWKMKWNLGLYGGLSGLEFPNVRAPSSASLEKPTLLRDCKREPSLSSRNCKRID